MVLLTGETIYVCGMSPGSLLSVAMRSPTASEGRVLACSVWLLLCLEKRLDEQWQPYC